MRLMRCGVCRYWMPVGPHYLSLHWQHYEQTCPACSAHLVWQPSPWARVLIPSVSLGISVLLGAVAGGWWAEYVELCDGNPVLAAALAACLGVGLIYLGVCTIGRLYPGKWVVRHTVRDDGTANVLHSRLAG